MGMTTPSGLIIPGSTMSEKMSLVLSVGPDCKHGIKPNDMVFYSQGVELMTKGPNGGSLFMVPENMIGVIEPCDGIYPRPKTAPVADTVPAANGS
jgi:hypothetical protein